MSHSVSSHLSHPASVAFGIAASITCQGLLFQVPNAIAQSIPSSPNPSHPPYKQPSATAKPTSTVSKTPSIAITPAPANEIVAGASTQVPAPTIGLSFSLDGPSSAPSVSLSAESSPDNPSPKAFEPPSSPPPRSTTPIAQSPSAPPSSRPQAAGLLSFEIPERPAPMSTATAPSSSTLPPALAQLFVGDSHSLAAIAIGAAEGTRTPEGGKTWAFKGHTDPGNGVWNLGTFSWQHGASSPDEADKKQLTRLQKQAAVLNRQAIALGVPWGLEEQLNALDLANQSPMAALNRGGYLERLQQAYDQEGLTGTEAILWARTWSYRHPSGTRWNAPGLGNTHQGIRTDQRRRMREIAKAINAQTAPAPAPTVTPNPTPPPAPMPNKGIDRLLDFFKGQEVMS